MKIFLYSTLQSQTRKDSDATLLGRMIITGYNDDIFI